MSPVLLLSRLVCALPVSGILLLGRVLGAVWYYLLPIRLNVAFRNVDRVFGATLSKDERRGIVRRSLVHQVLYVLDVLRAPALTAAESERRIERRGFEHLDRALAAGKGCIVVSAHLDSLDLATMSQTVRGIPVVGVVKAIGWPPAQAFVTLCRQRTGITLLEGPGARERLRAALQNNTVVTLAIDQHMPGHRGIVCSFFGALASTTPAPVRLALEQGCPILPAVMVRKGLSDFHLLRMEEPFLVETPYQSLEENVWHNTERLNRVVEGWVRETPDQWLWLHKRWKVQESPEGWKIPPSLQHLRGSSS